MTKSKYTMHWRIQYEGSLVSVMDEIRAIPSVVVGTIEQDMGKGKELISVKILTQHPPKVAYKAIRKMSLNQIENLKSVFMVENTLTKIF